MNIPMKTTGSMRSQPKCNKDLEKEINFGSTTLDIQIGNIDVPVSMRESRCLQNIGSTALHTQGNEQDVY